MENYPSADIVKNAHSGAIRVIENPTGDQTEFLNESTESNLTFFLISAGAFECMVNQSHYYLSPRSLVILPEKSFVKTLETSDDFKGHMVTIDRSFMDSLQIGMKTIVSWRRSSSPVINRLSKKDMDVYKMYLALILENMNEDTTASDEVNWLLTKAICCRLFGKLGEMENEQSETHTRKEALAKQFVALAQEEAVDHRELAYYADKLCVTPKYLSSVVSKITGKKATKWIDDCVMVHAMRLLKTTDEDISQISDRLSYQTPSDFSRCFKRITGMTPKQYRKTN